MVQDVKVLDHMLKGNTQRLWPGLSSHRASLLVRGWRKEFLEVELIEATARLGFSGLRGPGSVRMRPRENRENSSGINMIRDCVIRKLTEEFIG